MAPTLSKTKNIIFAPWTEEQVKVLNINQYSTLVHPYTCGRCRDIHFDGEFRLRATVSGWVCDSCDYTQDWCHEISLKLQPQSLRDLLSKPARQEGFINDIKT